MAWLPALALGALLGAPAPAAAHDTWVRPLPLRPPPAQALTVELSAGHGLRLLVATTVLQAPAHAQQPWSSRFATLSLVV